MRKEKKEKVNPLEEVIFTPDGKKTLCYLCDIIGVKNRVIYFNMIDKTVLHKQISIKEVYESEKKIFDYGLIFNNGFEIRNVAKTIFNLYPAEIIEKRERNDSLKLFGNRESKGSLSMFDVKNEIKPKQ